MSVLKLNVDSDKLTGELMDIDIEDRMKLVKSLFNSCQDDFEWELMMKSVKEHLVEVFDACDDEKYDAASREVQKAINIIKYR